MNSSNKRCISKSDISENDDSNDWISFLFDTNTPSSPLPEILGDSWDPHDELFAVLDKCKNEFDEQDQPYEINLLEFDNLQSQRTENCSLVTTRPQEIFVDQTIQDERWIQRKHSILEKAELESMVTRLLTLEKLDSSSIGIGSEIPAIQSICPPQTNYTTNISETSARIIHFQIKSKQFEEHNETRNASDQQFVSQRSTQSLITPISNLSDSPNLHDQLPAILDKSENEGQSKIGDQWGKKLLEFESLQNQRHENESLNLQTVAIPAPNAMSINQENVRIGEYLPQASSSAVINIYKGISAIQSDCEPQMDYETICTEALEVQTSSLDTTTAPVYDKNQTPISASNTLTISSIVGNNQRRFLCSFCDKTYVRKLRLKAHTYREHGITTYTCRSCLQIFSDKNSYCNHIEIHSVDCALCKRTFQNKTLKQKHQCSHKIQFVGNRETRKSKQLTPVSDDGSTPVSAPDKLTIHSTVVNDRRRFLCQFCDYTYFNKKLLKRHTNRKHGMTTYTCRSCLQVFTNRDSYCSHIKTHSVVCTLCKRTFRNKTIHCKHECIHKKK